MTRPAINVVDELLRRYPSSVRLQFRNFPLAFHPLAALTHEAAMSAASQGRFWEFVSYVLIHQDSLREQDLGFSEKVLSLAVAKQASRLLNFGK